MTPIASIVLPDHRHRSGGGPAGRIGDPRHLIGQVGEPLGGATQVAETARLASIARFTASAASGSILAAIDASAVHHDLVSGSKRKPAAFTWSFVAKSNANRATHLEPVLVTVILFISRVPIRAGGSIPPLSFGVNDRKRQGLITYRPAILPAAPRGHQSPGDRAHPDRRLVRGRCPQDRRFRACRATPNTARLLRLLAISRSAPRNSRAPLWRYRHISPSASLAPRCIGDGVRDFFADFY